MHKTRNSLSALVLAICLLMSVALGGKALAAGAGWHDLAATNSIKATKLADDDFQADIEDSGATVQYDVIKVASVTRSTTEENLIFTFDVEGFTDLKMDEKMDAEKWQAMAEEAAKKVTADTDKQTGTVGAAVEGLADGLYLVMPHGSNVTPEYGENVLESLKAYSTAYGYTFQPSLVAVPTREANADGVITTGYSYDDEGNPTQWLNEAVIELKASREPLFGDLNITKFIPEGKFAGTEPATFVFHVVGENYDEYASVYVTTDGSTSTTLKHIPAGLKVTVTEEYDGARYQRTSAASVDATIVANENVTAELPVASVSFTNEPDGDHTHGGHGIENHFEYVNDETKWDLTEQNGLVSADTNE